MMIQSITWANGAYTVTGLSSSASQFAAGFPLSTSYTSLLANLNPASSSSAPVAAAAVAAAGPNLGLIVGAAGAGVAVLIAAVAVAMVYRRKQKARRPMSFNQATQSPISMATLTKMFVPQQQSDVEAPPPPPSMSVSDIRRDDGHYYDPEQAVAKPRAMLRNDFIPTLQRQASNLTMIKTQSLAEFPPQHVLRSAQPSGDNRPQPTLGRLGDVQRAIKPANPFNKSGKTFMPPPPPADSRSESPSLQPPPPPPFPQY